MRAKVPDGSQWRLLDLENTTDDIQMKRVVLIEPIGHAVPSRVWCQGLVDQEPWTRVKAEFEGERIRIDLPLSEFYGMPLRMFLHRPPKIVAGGRWLLRGEDGETVLAPLVLKRVLPQSAVDIRRIEGFYTRGRV